MRINLQRTARRSLQPINQSNCTIGGSEYAGQSAVGHEQSRLSVISCVLTVLVMLNPHISLRRTFPGLVSIAWVTTEVYMSGRSLKFRRKCFDRSCN
jgi:hypothetical protein